MKKLPPHVCQSPQWGEFKTKMRTPTVRVGGVQFTIHRLPFTNYTIGYCPKPNPEKIDWQKLYEAGEKHHCVFIKVEPNALDGNFQLPISNLQVKPARPIFATETILFNLDSPEEEMLSKMHSKTRYNIRLAKRRGVEVKERSDPEAINVFLNLQRETAKRQQFFLHPDSYYRTLFEMLYPKGMVHLLVAGQITSNESRITNLASWMLLRYKDTFYYPYGGSSSKQRNLMASNLLMWEAIKLGKSLGCKTFDMWGATSDKCDPWYGLTRFKLGYGGEMVKFAGAYNLIIDSRLYPLVMLAAKLRLNLLNLKRRLL